MLVSAIVGGIIGGIAGAFSAAHNGDSVLAGFVTGAAGGAMMGIAAELLAGSAIAYIACATVCSAIAGVANIANQYWNYKIDKNASLQSNGGTMVDSGEFPEAYPSFSDVVNRQSVFAAMGSAALFTPMAAAAGVAFGDIASGAASGLEQVTVEIIVSLTTSGNLSMLQAITETILSIL